MTSDRPRPTCAALRPGGPGPRAPLRRALAALGTLAALALLVVPAPAGVPLVDGAGVPFRWDLDASGQPNVDAASGTVTYYVDAASLRDVVEGPKSAAAAVRDGIAAWAVGTTRIRFAPDATRPASSRNGSDRVNWIGWSSTELGPATFAATFPTRSGSRILDMDIVLNDRSFSWDTWSSGVPGDADIQALVAHEWGHAVGCEHVPLRASTMYFAAETGQIALRSIEPDDVALVGSIYPNDVFRLTTASITGRVTVAGPSDDRAVHVVAVSVATAEPAASTLTRPDGTFSIDGLPLGAYRVLAAPCNPLGNAMNSYWRSGSTSFLPAVLADDTATPPRARAVRLTEAREYAVGTIAVASASGPFETNDSPVQARPIRVGDAVCARFESVGDQDWYEFTAAQGERLTLSVLCWEIGSDANPSLLLTDAQGGALRTSSDIRDSTFDHVLAGVDRDARIVGWSVPASGAYRVRVGQDVPTSSAQTFYVLFVTAASDAPSPLFTEVTATRDRIDADGAQTTTIVVRPRREDGQGLGDGATVQLAHTGAGTVGSVTDFGDGTYRATVTAPNAPGDDVFTVTISGFAGAATVPDALRLVYVGPIDAARSELRAVPRRVARDGTAIARFTPRDAAGEALGGGRVVALALEPQVAALGGVTEDASGEYAASLDADVTGEATLTATVDAQATAVQAPFAVGFDLDEVLAAASADTAAFRATPGLPKRAARDFGTAAKRIDAAIAAAPTKRAAALGRARSAMLAVRAGLARASGVDDPGTVRELALALHEAATAVVESAAPSNGREQGRLDRATRLLASGVSKFAAGDAGAATTKWLKAYRLASSI